MNDALRRELQELEIPDERITGLEGLLQRKKTLRGLTILTYGIALALLPVVAGLIAVFTTSLENSDAFKLTLGVIAFELAFVTFLSPLPSLKKSEVDETLKDTTLTTTFATIKSELGDEKLLAKTITFSGAAATFAALILTLVFPDSS